MSKILYGFSISDQSREPVWFYNRQSAENYKNSHNKPDLIIETASEDGIDSEFILDTEGEIWEPRK